MALRSGAFVFHTDSAWAFTNTMELLLLTGVQLSSSCHKVHQVTVALLVLFPKYITLLQV